MLQDVTAFKLQGILIAKVQYQQLTGIMKIGSRFVHLASSSRNL